MPRLLEFFSTALSLGLELDERIAKGNPPASVQDVYAKLRTALDQAKAGAKAAGKRPEQVESSVFAVVAWLDEVIARNPSYWSAAAPLQVSLFNTNNAGNEFFYQLGSLKADDDEVREVYYHVMLIGFVGQYYFETGDNGELGKLKEMHARQLPIPPAPIHTLREERVTPQPYQSKDPLGPRYPRQWDRTLLKVGAVVAVLIPLLYLAWFFIAKPVETGPTLAEQVDQQLQAYACSDLAATVDRAGVTAVKGFVSKPDDIAKVSSDIAAIKGVVNPTFDIGLRIWPHCEVASILKAYRTRNIDKRFGLLVTPTTGHTDQFIDDERIVVRTQQPNYDGYVYVDYYTVDGTVIHLYPNKSEPDSGRLIHSAEQFNVGEQGHGWFVGAPFGQEMITVISSPVALYSTELPEYEQASAYLPKLRQMLEANGANDKLVANFLFMQTEPKK